MKSCPHRNSPPPAPGAPDPEERSLLQTMIQSLDRPEARIDRILVGNSLVGVLSGDRLGLASHLGAFPQGAEKALPDSMTGATCAEAAALLLEDGAFPVSLGMAALNAGLDPLAHGAKSEDRPVQQTVAELSRGGEAALVGQFPFTGWLRENVATLHLFELQPVRDRVPREKWDEVLAAVNVAAVTSTVFLTRHAHFYLSRVRNASCVMIGPSTPLTPCLFDQGVDILAGSVVTDPERVMRRMTEKGCFSEVVAAGGLDFVTLSA